jgi:hypothetical protein
MTTGAIAPIIIHSYRQTGASPYDRRIPAVGGLCPRRLLATKYGLTLCVPHASVCRGEGLDAAGWRRGVIRDALHEPPCVRPPRKNITTNHANKNYHRQHRPHGREGTTSLRQCGRWLILQRKAGSQGRGAHSPEPAAARRAALADYDPVPCSPLPHPPSLSYFPLPPSVSS